MPNQLTEAVKAALLAFTRTTAQDLGPYGINVNMLSGGLLQTTDASRATPDAVFELIAASTPCVVLSRHKSLLMQF